MDERGVGVRDRGDGPSERDLREAVPRDRGGRELRVGAFVLVGLVSFVVVLFLLTDPATLRGRYMVVTTMEDAGGVRRGDPVQMRGVNIGRIHAFEMTVDGRVHVTLEIEGEWDVPQGSRVTLGESGIFGGRIVEVVPGPGDAPPVEPWDTIGGTGAGSSLLETAGDLGTKAEEVLDRLSEVLSGPAVGSVEGSAAELEELLREVRSIAEVQRDRLDQLTASLNRSARGLEEAAEAGPEVASAAARADSVLLQLNRTSTTLDRAVGSLDAILVRLERGEGTLGKLLRDDSLYGNLNLAAENLSLLAEDIRMNPKRYLTVEIF